MGERFIKAATFREVMKAAAWGLQRRADALRARGFVMFPAALDRRRRRVLVRLERDAVRAAEAADARRENKRALDEGRGDYLREQRKDGEA